MARLLAALTATVTFLLAAPSSAYADLQDGRITLPVAIDQTTGDRFAAVPDWQKAGNCTVFPEMTVRVIQRADPAATTYVVRLHATVFTIAVHGSADVWHEYLSLRDASGALIAGVTFDGPQMTRTFTDYTWDAQVSVPLTVPTYLRIAKIQFVASC
ncbi:hypothetical protein [Cryptosporangium sp. NPDC051539]|uniref:hypothetical protein n=1 Tax=Cryptosporangium sp. NPDC051539 TaxID=3363962 RepID=UPI00378E91AF